MLRLVELALFLAPFAIFLAWRFFAVEGGPSPRVVVTAACVLALLTAALVWLSRYESLPPGTAYAPARLQDGEVIPGSPVTR